MRQIDVEQLPLLCGVRWICERSRTVVTPSSSRLNAPT
jgi:hypothetical protein